MSLKILILVCILLFKNYTYSSTLLQDYPDEPYRPERNGEDYVTETIRRLSHVNGHVPGNFQEDYQRSLYHENQRSEGRLVRDGLGSCVNQNEIHRSIKALDCTKPLLRTIKLASPGPNYVIIPSVAQVKRCSGHCNNPRACLPSRKSSVFIPVYQIDRSNFTLRQTCVEFELEQHEECRCGCAVQSRHCTKNQVHDEGNCACICKNQEEKHRCLELQYSDAESFLNQRYWDEPTCECRCVPKRCMHSMVWVPSMCRCVTVPTEDDDDNMLL